MGAGELDVSRGAGELPEADFAYNVAELKPGAGIDGGTLTIRTPSVRTGIASLPEVADYRYEWDLRLNDDVPRPPVLAENPHPPNERLIRTK